MSVQMIAFTMTHPDHEGIRSDCMTLDRLKEKVEFCIKTGWKIDKISPRPLRPAVREAWEGWTISYSSDKTIVWDENGESMFAFFGLIWDDEMLAQVARIQMRAFADGKAAGRGCAQLEMRMALGIKEQG